MRKVALCLLLAGCGGGEQIACTLIACINGLGVVISNPPQGAYRVDVIAPGETAPHSVNCNGTDCGPQLPPVMPINGAAGAFFANYFSSTVTISIVPASGSQTTFNKTASYATTFPNGPQCDIGGCTSAVVTVP
jgi:hypothetical protein